ncbi:MAG: hypothetical protein AAFS07_18950, partial [Pseudomonadota bacterium]
MELTDAQVLDADLRACAAGERSAAAAARATSTLGPHVQDSTGIRPGQTRAGVDLGSTHELMSMVERDGGLELDVRNLVENNPALEWLDIA